MDKKVFIKDIMTAQVVTIGEFETLKTAEFIFLDKSIHHLPVVQDDILVGIISNTDVERCKYGKSFFVNRKTSEYNEALLASTCVGSIMIRDVSTIHPDDPISKAYDKFKNNEYRSLPVLDDEQVVGIVTPLDLLDYFFQKVN